MWLKTLQAGNDKTRLCHSSWWFATGSSDALPHRKVLHTYRKTMAERESLCLYVTGMPIVELGQLLLCFHMIACVQLLINIKPMGLCKPLFTWKRHSVSAPWFERMCLLSLL